MRRHCEASHVGPRLGAAFPESPRRIAIGACMLLALSACAPGVKISLQIIPDIDENGDRVPTAALQSLTITIDGVDTGDRNRFSVEINRDEQVPLGPITVRTDEPFTIDVWGCTGLPCEIDDVLLRGCTPADEPLDFRDHPPSYEEEGIP